MNATYILLGFFMIFLNIYGYRRWLEPYEESQWKLDDSRKQVDSLISNSNWLFLIIIFIVAIVPLTFYLSSAIYFSTSVYLLAYGVLQFILKLINVIRLIIYTYNRKAMKRVLLNKILHPIDTIYITYFLCSIFFK